MAGSLENRGKLRELIDKFQFVDVKTKLVTGKSHRFTCFFYAFYLTMWCVLEASVRMACPSYKKRRPSSKAPASKNICDCISNA